MKKISLVVAGLATMITIMFFFLPYGICLYMRITEEDKLLAELK